MPESMYDKLGDLLNAALDSGFILEEKKRGVSASSAEKPEEENKSPKEEKYENPKKESFQKENLQNKKAFIPENVKKALSKIQIPEESDFESAKKIYREKLKLYHPDRRNDNPVLQKVAKEKTEQLLASWKIIENYFKNL